MSTFLATLADLDQSTSLIQELLTAGISPDSISVISKQVKDGTVGRDWIENDKIADATSFVGASDDPLDPRIQSAEDRLTSLTTGIEATGTAGIDTSDIGTDVDTVDEGEDSQSASEDTLYPRHGISNSTHEVDDLALTLRTGFPTTVPLQDNVSDRTSQLLDGLQTIVIPESGTIIGGGGLATAALDAFNPDKPSGFDSLRDFLKDEGVPSEKLIQYIECLDQGGVLLAVEIKPSSSQAALIESAVSRRGGESAELFDAPRYYNQSSGEKGYAF